MYDPNVTVNRLPNIGSAGDIPVVLICCVGVM